MERNRAMSGRLPGTAPRWQLWVGQQALVADPEADEIEALVIARYRSLGATAAAADQYAHYAATLREQLGVEPPALEEM